MSTTQNQTPKNRLRVNPSNYDLVVSRLPVTTRKEVTIPTTYTLLSDLTVSITKYGVYRISVSHNYTHAVPQGIIISRSNTDYTSSLYVLAKAETTEDVAVLSTDIIIYVSQVTNYYIWAKTKASGSNAVTVTLEYLGE